MFQFINMNKSTCTFDSQMYITHWKMRKGNTVLIWTELWRCLIAVHSETVSKILNHLFSEAFPKFESSMIQNSKYSKLKMTEWCVLFKGNRHHQTLITN